MWPDQTSGLTPIETSPLLLTCTFTIERIHYQEIRTMNAFTRFTMTLAMLTMATTSSVFGQSPDDEDDFNQTRSYRPSAANGDDFPALPASASELVRSRNSYTTPADPFGRSSRNTDPLRSRSTEQTRYRVPLEDSLNERNLHRGLRDRGYDNPDDNNAGYDRPVSHSRDLYNDESTYRRIDFARDEQFDRQYDRAPVQRNNDRFIPGNERDPFVPAPQPRDLENTETTRIDELLTIRYQNPVTVRAIRAMSSSQAVALFAEVSQKIDERSLEPTSYDVRVRRALRNLTLALDNPAFVNGLGLSADSFQMDGFRNTLARLADAGQVRNYQEARTALNTVMTQAQSVNGLTPSVVGFEFANASIDTLDKFSGLEPADPASRNGAELSGQKSASLEEEIVGVGVEVREHAEGLLVIKPLRGGPAAEAGLQTGDVILSINNRELAGMKMAKSVDLMKGSAGTQLNMRIFRDGKGERDFTLTRRKVRVWTVNDAKLLSGTDIGYFSLSRFSQSSTAEVDQALNSLYNSGMKSLIIDLRGNPGGLLTTCVEISDRFLACGTIVSTKGRLSGDNMQETATFAKTWNVPVVVLVDGDSASASEIFAAAIQENKRGVVVGTKSYGKGSVQTHFPLNAIGGDLRLTTALFYSPTGRKMAGEGVTPDIEINDRDGVANGDEVLAEAVRIARSPTLKDMAKASGTCRPANPSAGRSSSLSNIADPSHIGSAVR
jgi:carboxyl-terminal processing protease